MENYLEQGEQDRQDMVSNLETQGITGLSGNETFTQLVPQILNIQSGGDYVEQYSTMPTATSEDVGKIVQFTGTTGTYTNGYFYIGVSDGQETPTYSWEQLAVQPSTTSAYEGTIEAIQSNNYSAPFNFVGKKKGLYYVNSANMTTSTFYYKLTNSGTAQYLENGSMIMFYLDDDFDKFKRGDYIGVAFIVDGNNNKTTINRMHWNANSDYIGFTDSYVTLGGFLLTTAQTFFGTKTFNNIPKCSVAPTANAELSNKKYVDDKPTTYTGYDATKTQILKNVQGVLTWVDE